MTAAKGRSKQSGPDPGSASRAAETTPDFQAGSQTWLLLQTIMELQKTVGGLDESVKILSATVRDQSRKIDDCRTDLGAKIDTKFEKLTQEIGTNRNEIAKYAGGVSVARWFVGTPHRHWRTDRRPAVAPPRRSSRPSALPPGRSERLASTPDPKPRSTSAGRLVQLDTLPTTRSSRCHLDHAEQQLDRADQRSGAPLDVGQDLRGAFSSDSSAYP